MAIDEKWEDLRRAEIVFSESYKKFGPPVAIPGNHHEVIRQEIGIGEIKSYIDNLNHRFILMGTELGNVLVSRVNERRARSEGRYCYRVMCQSNKVGNFTRIKQNESVTGSQLAKILGYECDNLQTRLENKRTDGTNRFNWN